MSTQGMISDADGDIAALVYSMGDRPDLVLLDFARQVANSGRRICGLIQFRDRPFDAPRRRVMVLDGWREVDVRHENVAVGDSRCHVDEAWMDGMSAEVRTSITRGVDAVIVNRFGALEAAGGGFCDAIRVASETQTPLIIAVPAFEFERWTRCSNGMTVKLDCASSTCWSGGIACRPATRFCPRMASVPANCLSDGHHGAAVYRVLLTLVAAHE